MIRGASLVFQWLRICLLMLGTQLRSLIGELRFPHVSGQLVNPRAPAFWSPSMPQLERSPHTTRKDPACCNLRPDRAKKKKKIVDQSVTQSLRGSQVARLGQRCCFVIVVKIRVSCTPSPFPSWLWSSSLPCPVHVCLPLVPSRLGRGWKAGEGQRPVGPTGLQAREGPVWGWRWGWYGARLGVPAPGASMICKEIPLSVLWGAPPC